ncbi:MAG: hypothetical protein QE271_03305 [Bacteriovoracaceae bacterium]|nr:hypothetical protein [Bacteriovoracaceae bacterium]
MMPKAFVIVGLLLFILNFALDKVFASGPFIEEDSTAASTISEKSQLENTVKISNSVAKINLKSMRTSGSQGSRAIASKVTPQDSSTSTEDEIASPPPTKEPEIIRTDE